MAKLIDADVLKYAKFHGVTDWTPTEETSYQRGWNGAIDAIMRNAPTVDAVEVVRCKNCKYADENAKCRFVSWYNKKDDFCSRGERREDGRR